MADELVELLLRTERVNDPMTLKPRLINPDGPEAATTITRLTEEVAAQAREIARLRGPAVYYEKGFGPGDGESRVITGGQP